MASAERKRAVDDTLLVIEHLRGTTLDQSTWELVKKDIDDLLALVLEKHFRVSKGKRVTIDGIYIPRLYIVKEVLPKLPLPEWKAGLKKRSNELENRSVPPSLASCAHSLMKVGVSCDTYCSFFFLWRLSRCLPGRIFRGSSLPIQR